MPHAKFIKLTKNEEKIINLWREIKFGEIAFQVQDGIPIGIAKIEIKKDLQKKD